MRDVKKIVAPTVEQKIDVVIQGEEKLRSFARTLNMMAKGANVQDYWKSQEELINDVTAAFEKYQSVSSQSNAGELMKFVNALRAVSDTDISGLFKNFDKMGPAIKQAELDAADVAGRFSEDIFKDAFASFDLLRAEGLKIEEIFKRFSTSADVNQLRSSVEALNSQLQHAKTELQSAKSELEGYKASNGIQEIIDQVNQLQYELDNVRQKMSGEFKSFLSANGLGDWDIDWSSDLYRTVDECFDRIKEGSMTAQEAIARVKGEFSNLVSSDTKGIFDTEQAREFAVKIEQACASVEQLSAKINALENGGVLSSVAHDLSESEQLTEKQREAMSGLASEGGDLKSVAAILAELVRAGASAEGEINDVYKSLTDMLTALREVGSVDTGNLSSIGNLVQSFTKLGDLKVDNTSVAAVSDMVRALSSVQNIPDLSKIGNLNINAESLSSLATYLPQIASVNVSTLKKLADVDLSNFNNLKVDKDAMNDITQLADSVNSLRDAEDVYNRAQKAKEANERRRLSTLEQALNLLTKLEDAEKNWTAARGKKSDSSYSSLVQDSEALKRNLADFRNNQDAFLNLDNAEYSNFLNMLSEIKTRYADIANVVKANSEAVKSAAEKDLEALRKQCAGIEKLVSGMDGVAGTDAEKARIEDIRSRSSDLIGKVNLVREASPEYIKSLKAEADALEAGAKSASTFKVEIEDLDKARRNIGRAIDTLDKQVVSEKEKSQISNVKQLYKDLYAEIIRVHEAGRLEEGQKSDLESRAGKIFEIINALNAYTDAEKDAARAAAERAAQMDNEEDAQKRLTEGTKEYSNAVTKISNALASVKKMKGWTSAEHGKSSDDYKKLDGYIESLTELRKKIDGGSVTIDEFSSKFAELNSRIKDSANNMRNAGENTSTLAQRVGKLSEKFATWFSITRVITAAAEAIRRMITTVIDLDSAATQLQIVTGSTDKEMTRFLTNAISLAKELGQSITDVLRSIETFSRLGYDLGDASKLAEYAGVLSNVAAVDTDSATTCLTSIIKGFNMDVAEAEHVADVLIEVGQKYAVSAGEMMEAYERSGAALNATNTSFEKSAGLIAAANASVQNAEVVGTALKSVSARIRGSKTELEELGENTEELAEGFSKYAEELKGITGFDIMVEGTTNTFKDLYDIFDGISKVWDKLSDTQQSRVAEILGGTRQYQVISSILTNWKDAAGAYAAAMDSAGVATEANARYMESIEGRIGQFKAAFQEFANTLIDSSLVSGIVGIGTTFLNIATSVVSLIDKIAGLNKALFITAGIVATLKADLAGAFIDKIFSSIKTKLIPTLTTVFKNIPIILSAIKNGLVKTTVAGEGMASTLSVAFGTVTASITAAQLAVGALFAAIGVITFVVGKIKEARQEAINAANDIIDKYKDANESFSSNTKSLNDLRESFDKLSQGVDENGKNISLTADEYDEYLGIIDQIVSISPNLVRGYDNEGRAVLDYKNALDNAIESQERYAENQRNIYLGSGREIIDGTTKELQDAAPAMSEAGSKLFEAAMGGIFDGSQDKVNAFYEALSMPDIDWNMGLDSTRSSTGKLMKIYENYDKIMVMLRNSAAYTEDELLNLEMALQGLAGPYTELVSIQQKQLNWLTEFSKSRDWYNAIPTEALDEFSDGLANVNSQYSTYSEKVAAAEHYGSEFARAIAGDSAKHLTELADGLSAGTVSIEDYNAAVEDFKKSFDGDGNVLDGLLSFFNSLSNNFQKAEEETRDYTLNLQKLTDVISELKSSYSALEAAENEMRGGSGLSVETIEKLAAAEENYLDYLYEENGVVKINTEAWKENANAKILGDIDKLKDEIDSLKERNEALKENIENNKKLISSGRGTGAMHDEIARDTAELEENTKAIEKHQNQLAVYNSVFESITNSTYNFTDSLKELSDAAGAIDNVSKALGEFNENGHTSIETLSGLIDKFGGFSSFDDFVNVMSDSASSMEEAQNACNMLAAEYINSLGILDQVTDSNSKIIEVYLEEMGVMNAHEVVLSRLTTSKLETALAAESLSMASWEEAKAFLQATGASEAEINALQRLRQEQYNAKVAATDFSAASQSVVRDLIAQANAAGVAASGIKALTEIQRLKKMEESGGISPSAGASYGALLRKYAKEAMADLSSIGSIVLPEVTVPKPTSSRSGSSSPRGSSGTKASTKEIEEYIADINEYREAEERLRKTQEEAERLENRKDNAGSYEKKIALQKDLIAAYKDEQAALHELNNARDASIDKNVKSLRELGFVVEYNADTNELWIENMERLNELTADSKGKYDTLQEATNALREDTEKMIETTTELNDANREGSATWWELRNSIIETTVAMYENRVAAHENKIKLAENWRDAAISEKDFDDVKRHSTAIISEYKAMQREIHEEADYYRSMGYSDTSDEVSELSDL